MRSTIFLPSRARPVQTPFLHSDQHLARVRPIPLCCLVIHLACFRRILGSGAKPSPTQSSTAAAASLRQDLMSYSKPVQLLRNFLLTSIFNRLSVDACSSHHALGRQYLRGTHTSVVANEDAPFSFASVLSVFCLIQFLLWTGQIKSHRTRMTSWSKCSQIFVVKRFCHLHQFVRG